MITSAPCSCALDSFIFEWKDSARSYTYTELISNNSSPTSWYALAQQVLGERITADMQAHNSCCAAEDIGFSGL